LAQLLADCGLASSKGEARRLIEQGGVKINNEKATGANAVITIVPEGLLVQVGKRRFQRIVAE
jgi:tyrosyl-tRNA synthetase